MSGTRKFACQGCGKVVAVLHGARVKCACGTTSAAEIIDPAAGGYFTVQDKGDGHYDVRGYTARGGLLLHTWHIGEHSLRMECEAWKARGAHERPFDRQKVV